MDNPYLASLDWWSWWILTSTTITAVVAVVITCLAISDARRGSLICAQGHSSYGRGVYCPECGGKRWKNKNLT